MKVTVNVYAFLRSRTGWGSREVELKSSYAKLVDVLEVIPELKEIVIVDGDIDRAIIILVNGRNIRQTGGLDTMLTEWDRIDVFPPAAGG